MNHDFLLLDREVDGDWELLRFIQDPRALHLHDDLLQYMSDTIAWIPSFNPARREPHHGLCWYGPTIIGVEGAEAAGRVFRAWADLFSAGPPVLPLTGGFSWIDDDNPGSAVGNDHDRRTSTGDYERLELDRDEVVAVLRRLAEYAERVQAAKGRLYLLHQGL